MWHVVCVLCVLCVCRYVLALTARRAEAQAAREAEIIEQARIINAMSVGSSISSPSRTAAAAEVHSEHHTHTGEIGVTFREVVESFAAQHSVTFAPRPGRTYDGRQIFNFNGTSCYLDNNQSVAYIEMATKWGPISLQDLLEYTRNKQRSAAS